jgi:hypothetical protein
MNAQAKIELARAIVETFELRERCRAPDGLHGMTLRAAAGAVCQDADLIEIVELCLLFEKGLNWARKTLAREVPGRARAHQPPAHCQDTHR